jgi:hypothetical protein
MVKRVFRLPESKKSSTAIMARLIKSEAVPCIGALMAARSAPARACAFFA